MSRPAVQDQINGLKVAVQPLSVDLFITGPVVLQPPIDTSSQKPLIYPR